MSAYGYDDEGEREHDCCDRCGSGSCPGSGSAGEDACTYRGPSCSCGQVPCRRWRHLSSFCPGPVTAAQEAAEPASPAPSPATGPYPARPEEQR